MYFEPSELGHRSVKAVLYFLGDSVDKVGAPGLRFLLNAVALRELMVASSSLPDSSYVCVCVLWVYVHICVCVCDTCVCLPHRLKYPDR